MGFFRAIVGAILSVFRERDHPQVAPFPPLDLNITFVSNPTPQAGETVTIRWDYGNSDRLVSQTWQLHSLTFDGRRVSVTHGCLPTSLLPAGQPADPCISNADREVTFQFKGPVIFDLIAQSDDDKIYEQMVRLALPDMSFSVNATVQIPGFPRFAPQGADIPFERAFGIVEQENHDGREDGVINQLASDPFFSVAFPASTPFFMTSNRRDLGEVGARFENMGFGSLLGRQFPPLKFTFLGSRDGEEFRGGSRSAANITIIGLTFAIDGPSRTVPTANDKPATVIVPSVRSLEPIFVQIDLRSSSHGKPIVVSDIHIGNIAQGLVLPVHHGNNDSVQTTGVSTGDDDIEPITTTGATRQSSGTIEEARTGLRIVRAGQQNAIVVHATISVTWSNIPVFSDIALGELMDTQFPPP